MVQRLSIHPKDPQQRLIKQAVSVLHAGGVIVYPTDSGYALACHLGDKEAATRIRQIRRINEKHHLTLVCRDLSELGTYAKVTNTAIFRLIKSHTPGPYTFLLKATREVPKRLLHPKRKTIGLRIPANPVGQALLAEFGEPLMSTSLIMPGEEEALLDPDIIVERLAKQVDLIVDVGYSHGEPTSVIDLYGDEPVIIREGLGDVGDFRR